MRGLLLVPVLTLGACDDTEFGSGVPTVSPSGAVGGDYCAAQAIFEAHCAACHGAGGGAAGLDLESDPWAATVGVPSANTPGAVLVEPFSPEGSLLFRKVRGTQTADEGGTMPPSASLSTHEQALLWEWIEAGATETCAEPPDTGAGS